MDPFVFQGCDCHCHQSCAKALPPLSLFSSASPRVSRGIPAGSRGVPCFVLRVSASEVRPISLNVQNDCGKRDLCSSLMPVTCWTSLQAGSPTDFSPQNKPHRLILARTTLARPWIQNTTKSGEENPAMQHHALPNWQQDALRRLCFRSCSCSMVQFLVVLSKRNPALFGAHSLFQGAL